MYCTVLLLDFNLLLLWKNVLYVLWIWYRMHFLEFSISQYAVPYTSSILFSVGMLTILLSLLLQNEFLSAGENIFFNVTHFLLSPIYLHHILSYSFKLIFTILEISWLKIRLGYALFVHINGGFVSGRQHFWPTNPVHWHFQSVF